MMHEKMFKNVAKVTKEPNVSTDVVNFYYQALKELRDDPEVSTS